MELRFPLILDGATGTELQRRGYTGDISMEQWTLAHPDCIRELQRGYVDAGSRVLYTPTFGGNAVRLAAHGVTEDVAAYNRRLAALTREAAGGRALVAGDMAPTGLFLPPLGDASFRQLVDAYAQQVAGLEGMELAPDAATLIARIADGALRDGLSILDQCAGRSKQITAQLVSEVAGLAGREALYRLSDAVLARDSSAAVEELAQLHENSYDMERLCVEMINHFRNFMMVKTVKKSRELIICTDDEYKHIEESAGQFTLAQILRGLDLFQSTLVKIKGGATPRIEMEMAFIRLCEPKLETDSDAINQRLSALERAVQNGVPAAPVKTVQSPAPAARPAPAQPTVPPTPQPTPAAAAPAPEPEPVSATSAEPVSAPVPEPAPVQPEPPVPPEPAAAAPSPAPAADSEQKLFMQWADLMEILHRTDIALFGVLSGSQGYTRGEFFLIDSPNPTIKEFIKISTHAKAIRAALHELTGHNYKLGLFKKKSIEQAPRRDPLEDLLSKARENHIQIEEH